MVNGLENRDTIEKLLVESVRYCPETGKFFWLEDRPQDHFKSVRAKTRWLKMFAGKEIKGSCAYGRTKKRYFNIRLNGYKLKAHRVAWWFIHQEWPSGDIDHLDGNGLNNKIENLRDVSRQINTRNSALSINNTSGLNGIHQRKDTGKWVARGNIVKDGIHIRVYLGQFETPERAHEARLLWEEKEGNFTERHGK